MRPLLQNLLREPSTGDPLEVTAFTELPESSGGGIEDGVLFNPRTRRAYPVCGGVPVLLADAFPPEFVQRYADQIADLRAAHDVAVEVDGTPQWSFSGQWDHHFTGEVDRTWGYSVEDRIQLFLMELQVDASWCAGKRILDAGCGAGDVTHGIAQLGAEVVGLDYSSSVRHAERGRSTPNAHFAQGDLLDPPLAPESFDAVTSIGVLHHTPDTHRAFAQVARLVKPGGRLYVWLYRKQDGWFKHYVKMPVLDAARTVISRMPPRLQHPLVQLHAWMIRGLHRLKHGTDHIPAEEYLIAAYDDLTPRWRHYHTAYEVGRWFHECGFAAPTLSHWDNPYGFGMVAIKTPQTDTAGIHFGEGRRLWDDRQTILG